MKKFVSVILIATVLVGCSNFSTRLSREGTQIITRDQRTIYGELIGVKEDSIIYTPKYGTSRFEKIYYTEVERIRLLNDGYPGVSGFFGFLTFGLLGSVVGAYAEHGGNSGGDYARVIGGLVGLLVGGIAGAIIGSSLVTDKDIEIRTSQDVYLLQKYVRYTNPIELQMARSQ